MTGSIIPKPLQGVICDMDGLLLDTEAAHAKTMKQAAADLGYKLTDDIFLRMVGVDRPHNKQMLRQEFGPEFPLDAFYRNSDGSFEALVRSGILLRPGVHQLLDALDKLGVRRAVATSTARAPARERLRFSGVLERFHHVVGLDDVVHPKPAPDCYLKAAELLGADPAHCLALEDSHNGVRAAAAAGCATVMVPDLLSETPEMASLTLAVLPSLREVAELLLKQSGSA